MRCRSFSVAAVLVLALVSCGGAADLVVAPDGKDTNPGTADQPLATLQKARDLARARIARGLTEPLHIILRAGTYRLTEPLMLDHRDRGTDTHPVVYTAWPGEKAVISGGRAIADWKANPDGTWSTTIDEVREGQWTFRELFVEGKRCTRARHPDTGYLRVDTVGPDKRTSFTFHRGDVPEVPDVAQVELVFLHDWSLSRIALKAIDEETRVLRTAHPVGCAARHYAMDWFEKHPRYFLENSRAYLNAPGEWYLDVKTGVLTYRPHPDEIRDRNLDAVAPRATALVRIQGTADRPVKNLHFTGITFAHCAFHLPKGGYADGQATVYEQRDNPRRARQREMMPAAFTVDHGVGLRFNRCSFQHLGGSGLWLRTGCRDSIVERCHFTDISGNGLMIGNWLRRPEEIARNNQARNNLIEHCGQQYFSGVGVWAGITEGTQVLHNEIRHLPYTGVSLGWQWNPNPTPARANVVAFNHIHQVMQILSDGGGIYTLGRQPDSRLASNWIHDIPLNAGRAESNGMFLDEGSTGFVIENNLIHDVARSPLRFHKATTNLVRNNILVTAKDIPVIRYNNTNPQDITQEDNRVVATVSASEIEKMKRATGIEPKREE
jgi:hypothetical protein